MNCTQLPVCFQSLLADIPYVTAATTCADGSPWNRPLVGYFDNDLNLYWASSTESQHSVNIANNNAIFAVMYDSSWSLGTGEALYSRLRARMLIVADEIRIAKAICVGHCGKDDCPEAFAADCFFGAILLRPGVRRCCRLCRRLHRSPDVLGYCFAPA